MNDALNPSCRHLSYLDQAFRRCLKRKDLLEYRQTNLAVAAKLPELFTPPPGIAEFDYIFDLTGKPLASTQRMLPLTDAIWRMSPRRDQTGSSGNRERLMHYTVCCH